MREKERKRMKRKITTRILLLVLLCTGTSLSGETHSKKTFLMPRAVGVNAAMEHTTWHSQIYTQCKESKHKINSHIQLTPFYQHSDDKNEVGRYFGVGNGSNTFSIGDAATVLDKTANIDGEYLIHDTTNVHDSWLKGTTVTFNPEQEIYGARLDFFQSINSPIKGLFFKASMPFVHVENDMNMTVALPTDGHKGEVEIDPTHKYTVTDFFAGRVDVPAATSRNDFQSPLAHAKIDGSRSATGIADIDMSLGYKLLSKKTKYAFLSIGITIPTGNEAHGEYVFEPLYGNGDHFGLGGAVNAGIELWKGAKGWVRVDGTINYKYLFEGTEKRTLGAKADDKLLSHYYLGRKMGTEEGVALAPLANALTQDVRVKPGSQIDSLINFSFNTKLFVIDLGYNMYWKDAESVSAKNWEENIYAIATPDFETSAAFDDPDLQIAFTHDADAARTPTQFTHKIFGAVAYKMNISKRYPTSVGLGGSYEFVHENSALEQYAIWAKAGISF